MIPTSSRIVVQGTTPHVHEQKAVAALIDALPDADPFRVWCLFDLVDPSGRRYEIDALVLAPHGLYHVEIKSHPASVSGDSVDWRFSFTDGGSIVRESPMRLAELKSRVLASELRKKLGQEAPFVETLIYLSDATRVDLAGPAAVRVLERKHLKKALQFGELPGVAPSNRPPIDNRRAGRIIEALKQLGIRKSASLPRVGAYVIDALLDEGPGYQDREAHNERLPEMKARVRSWLVPEAPTAERRDQLRRAAEREARLLTAVGDHPHILAVRSFEPDGPFGGPCVVFEQPADAVTLDVFLRRHPKLPFERRLAIVEQVADAVAYCHRKKVLHRGISPGSVLVRERPDGKGVDTRLFNFQLASGEGSGQGTKHISQVGGDRAIVYRAPELIENPANAGEEADLFAIGALAYFVMTGRHPGATLVERQKLFDLGGGKLSLAAVDDSLAGGAALPAPGSETAEAARHRTLDEVVGVATEADSLQRYGSVAEWLDLLVAHARIEPVSAPVEQDVDPLAARPEDILAREYLVEKVLGTGATARVLRVSRERSTYALKVSRGPELDERLRAEAAALKRLRGERIVELHDTLVLGGRVCLLLQDAGETLGDLLAKEGAQSLDLAQRWGDDLLLALRELEAKDIRHRDIKPANLGVPSGSAKTKRSLFLFDFSLAGAAPDQVDVGTPAYRDPFVFLRGTWDTAADRYGAAVTLYEILTGARPAWSSGEAAVTTKADAAMIIEAERFDPSVRDRLHAFFKQAFARDAAARHESAEAMRDAWLACFLAPQAAAAPAVATTAPSVPPPALDVSAFTETTPIQAVDALSPRAKNALDRSGVIVVRDALALPLNQLSAIRGVGRDTAKEIHAFVRALREGRPASHELPFVPDFTGSPVSVRDLDLSAGAVVALESAGLPTARDVADATEARLTRVLARVPDGVAKVRAALLAARRPATVHSGDPVSVEDWVRRLFPVGKKSHEYVREVFGLDEAPGGGYALTVAELAKRHGQTGPSVSIPLGKAREKWRADAAIDTLAEPVLAAIDAAGGIATVDRLGDDLLQRLPHEPGDATTRAASALVRVVAEVRDDVVRGRNEGRVWLARSQEHLTLARTLGRKADELAAREPLPAFETAREALAKLTEGTALEALAAERLVELAAESSRTAASSARLELYPRGMDAERALRLSAGALGSARIEPEQVRRTVALRYPEAKPLPEADAALARLVASLGLVLEGGAFVRPGAESPTTTQTQLAVTPSAHTTWAMPATAPGAPVDPETIDRHVFEKQLRTAARNRSFRVVMVNAAYADKAAAWLSGLLETPARSLERDVIDGLDALAQELDIDPSIVAETDRRGPDGGDDWVKLCELVGDAATRVVRPLLDQPGTLLFTQPGLFARYRLEAPLHALRDATQRDDGPGVFLVVPQFAQAGCTIDAPTGALPVPISSPAQCVRILDAWLASGSSTA